MGLIAARASGLIRLPMSPKAAAAIGLRIVGIWFVLQSVVGFISIWFTNRSFLEGIHRRLYDGSVVTTGTDLYLHDTYYIVSHIASPTTLLVIGIGLLLLSKPLAWVVSRKLENF